MCSSDLEQESAIRELSSKQQADLQQQVRDLNMVDPEKSQGAAKKMINTLSQMRDVNGKHIINESALQSLNMELKMVDDLYGKTEKAAQFRKAIMYKGLSAAGLTGAGYGTYQVVKALGD